jgi:hypothetical protein
MRRTLMVLVGASACSPAEPTVKQPDAVVERDRAEPPAPQDAAAQHGVSADPPSSNDGLVALLGVVHEGGVRVCDSAGSDAVWTNLYWAVGFTPLVHDDAKGTALRMAKGHVVLVRGKPVEGPRTVHDGGEELPEARGMCMPLQMRSDWELWPDGTRSNRGDGPNLRAFSVTSVEHVSPLRVKARDEDLSITVVNPFFVPLKDATLVAHYEGCYGKPMQAVERRPVGTLKSGAMKEDLTVPMFVQRDGPRGRVHRLDSIQLLGAAEARALDLDVRVRDLGATVECPER